MAIIGAQTPINWRFIIKVLASIDIVISAIKYLASSFPAQLY
jgi:hypothetical protein